MVPLKRETVLQQVMMVAWADGAYDEREARLMEELIDALGLDGIPDGDPAAASDALPRMLESAEDRECVYQLAAKMSYADGRVDHNERELLDQLRASLEISDEDAADLEAGARVIMDDSEE